MVQMQKKYENHSIIILVIMDKPFGKISLYNKFTVILNVIFYQLNMSHVQKKTKTFYRKIYLQNQTQSFWVLYDHAGKSWNENVAIQNSIYRQLQCHSFVFFFPFLKFFCVVCSKIGNFLSTSPSKSRIKEAIA